jgi:hypothetical protein
MFRVDAQHSFAPPNQGPDWYGKILARNKFAGSIYVPHEGSVDEAIALAEKYPYIRRVVPTVHPDGLGQLPDHPLISSVHLTHPAPAALSELQQRRLAAEIDVQHWPFPAEGPVALIGMPDAADLPPNVYVKLTGFRLPVTAQQKQKLQEMLQKPGAQRILFASGWPYGGGTWKETLAAFTQCLGAQTIDLREQILGDTARDFYRL